MVGGAPGGASGTAQVESWPSLRDGIHRKGLQQGLEESVMKSCSIP